MGSLYRHVSLSLLGWGLWFNISACSSRTTPGASFMDPRPATKIARLGQKSEGTTVVVEGKVRAIAPLVEQSVYEVEDKSGTIWVLTDDSPPPQNAQVKVHGVIRSSNGERYLAQK